MLLYIHSKREVENRHANPGFPSPRPKGGIPPSLPPTHPPTHAVKYNNPPITTDQQICSIVPPACQSNFWQTVEKNYFFTSMI